MARKIIQIEAVMNKSVLTDGLLLVYALCDDGTLWIRSPWVKGHESWDRIEDIPQD